MQEPKDGDFVAYVDALQRESAARLAQQNVHVIDTTAAAASSGHFFEKKPEAATPANLEQAIDRFIRRDTDAGFVKAVVAAVAGAIFLLNWMGNGGAVSFLVAAALLAYALPRLLRAFRAIAREPGTPATVERVFGRTRPPTSGARK